MILCKRPGKFVLEGKAVLLQQQQTHHWRHYQLRKMSGNNMFASPKRDPKLLGKLDSTPTSPPLNDIMMYPWNWGAGAHKIDLSPASSCGSPENEQDRLKRGRPRADNITNLIIEGTKIASSIRCNICNRVFPREKSLQAHMRTHTGKLNSTKSRGVRARGPPWDRRGGGGLAWTRVFAWPLYLFSPGIFLSGGQGGIAPLEFWQPQKVQNLGGICCGEISCHVAPSA